MDCGVKLWTVWSQTVDCLESNCGLSGVKLDVVVEWCFPILSTNKVTTNYESNRSSTAHRLVFVCSATTKTGLGN